MEIFQDSAVIQIIPIKKTFGLANAAISRYYMYLLMVASDIFSFIISWFLSVALRICLLSFDLPFLQVGYTEGWQDFYVFRELFFILPVLIVIMSLRQLYPGVQLGVISELQRLITTISMVFLMVLTFSFFGKAQQEFSRAMVGGMWMFTLVLIPIFRSFVRWAAVRVKVWGEPIAVMGDKAAVDQIIDHLNRNKKLGLIPSVSIVHQNGQKICREDISQLKSLVKTKHIHTMIIAQNEPYISLQGDWLDAVVNLFKRPIFVNTNFFDQMLWVDTADLGGMMGFEIKQNLTRPGAKIIKRMIDIFGSGLGLVFLSPLFLILSIWIVVDSKGSPFYYQVRVGKDNKEFKFFKFRTMHRDADEIIKKQLLKDPILKEEWEKFQKLKIDARITRAGNFLRRYSLDELPQLWNILKGDMSLVGPRPFMVSQREDYGKSMSNYLMVRPGLTGMWQVSGRNNTTFQKRVQFDNYYVRNWSIWLDIYILIRTFIVVLKKDGAY